MKDTACRSEFAYLLIPLSFMCTPSGWTCHCASRDASTGTHLLTESLQQATHEVVELVPLPFEVRWGAPTAVLKCSGIVNSFRTSSSS